MKKYLLPFKIGPGDMHLLVLQNILVGTTPINNFSKSQNIISGLKYKIVDDSVIPTDRSFRGAWEVDEAELTDGVGA